LEQEGFNCDLDISAMFGYVQKNDFGYWYEKVNFWINDLINQPKDCIAWSKKDKLSNIETNKNFAEYISEHSRITKESIKLYHFWFKI
jgi:hypothetical protein